MRFGSTTGHTDGSLRVFGWYVPSLGHHPAQVDIDSDKSARTANTCTAVHNDRSGPLARARRLETRGRDGSTGGRASGGSTVGVQANVSVCRGMRYTLTDGAHAGTGRLEPTRMASTRRIKVRNGPGLAGTPWSGQATNCKHAWDQCQAVVTRRGSRTWQQDSAVG